MPYNDPLEDEDELDLEEPMPAMEGGVPNVPRNPDREDPRQKIKDYLARQEMRNSPEMRQMQQAPLDELRASDRDIAFQNLLQKSAAQMGTIGGKAASTAGYDEFSKNLMAQNQGIRGDIMGQRQAAQGDEDRQMKIRQYLADRMMSDEQRTQTAQLSRDKMKQQKDYQDRMLGLKAKGLEATAGATGLKPTPGEKKTDEEYAKVYTEYMSGGRDSAKANLSLLDQASKKLEKSKNDFMISGKVVGGLPEFFRSPQSIEIQQDVNQAAISALKAALGSQFTEKENLAIQRLSYDPRLTPDMNQKKINRAMQYIKAKIKSTEEKNAFYEKNRKSLSGYVSPDLELDKLLTNEEDPTAKTPAVSASPSGTVKMQNSAGKIFHIPAAEVDAVKNDPDEPLTEVQ